MAARRDRTGRPAARGGTMVEGARRHSRGGHLVLDKGKGLV